MGWFWENEIETNNKENSIKNIKIKTINFDTLWDNYPSHHIKHKTKSSEDIFDNHCAIDLSEAFIKSNISMKSLSKKFKCWGECNHPRQHAFRAQDLANWLKKHPIVGFQKMQKFKGLEYEEKLKGKKGIIFFKDYWQRPHEKGNHRTGDHIDLWNDGTLASMGSVKSFIRIGLGISIDGLWSDFAKSKEVLFWEKK